MTVKEKSSEILFYKILLINQNVTLLGENPRATEITSAISLLDMAPASSLNDTQEGICVIYKVLVQ